MLVLSAIWATLTVSTAEAAESKTTQAAHADAVGNSLLAPFSGLVTLDGKVVSDGPMIGQGKWTLVMIWVTNCHICRGQKPKISAFHEARKDVDATVFGIAMDGEDKINKVKKFLTELDVRFPTYVGDMMSVMKDYERLTREPFQGTPTYLLFDPQGTLRGNNPGPVTVSALERFIDRHSNNR